MTKVDKLIETIRNEDKYVHYLTGSKAKRDLEKVSRSAFFYTYCILQSFDHDPIRTILESTINGITMYTIDIRERLP